jgi:hypothetical protein
LKIHNDSFSGLRLKAIEVYAKASIEVLQKFLNFYQNFLKPKKAAITGVCGQRL